jgi:hypothetical protein
MTSPYRNPGQEREFIDKEFKSFFSEVDAAEKARADAAEAAQAEKEAGRAAAEAENRYWGFAESPESLVHRQPLPADHFRFADLHEQPWAYYKNQTWLKKHLFKVGGYPDRFINSGFLTKVGFDILMENKRLAERASDRERKAKARTAKRAALASSAAKEDVSL